MVSRGNASERRGEQRYERLLGKTLQVAEVNEYERRLYVVWGLTAV
jgi:hypothetical protein